MEAKTLVRFGYVTYVSQSSIRKREGMIAKVSVSVALKSILGANQTTHAYLSSTEVIR